MNNEESEPDGEADPNTDAPPARAKQPWLAPPEPGGGFVAGFASPDRPNSTYRATVSRWTPSSLAMRRWDHLWR
jgi:hypothetical protein